MLMRLRSLSLRAKVLIVAALVVLVGAAPAYAYWTAQQTVPAKSFTFGTLDIRVNGQDATAAATALAVAGLVPGNTVAGLVTVANSGTLPLGYWLTVVASNPDGKALAAALQIAAWRGGGVSGAAPTATCTGGASIVPAPSASPVVPTATPTPLGYGPAASARQTLMPSATETVCVQLRLPTTAPNTVQSASTAVTIAANGAQVGAP